MIVSYMQLHTLILIKRLIKQTILPKIRSMSQLVHVSFVCVVGVFLFSGLCVLGTGLVAVGAMLKGHPSMFPLMLLGRILFG